MVDFMENVGKYTDYSNRSYGIKVVAFQEVVKILFFCPRICVLRLGQFLALSSLGGGTANIISSQLRLR